MFFVVWCAQQCCKCILCRRHFWLEGLDQLESLKAKFAFHCMGLDSLPKLEVAFECFDGPGFVDAPEVVVLC